MVIVVIMTARPITLPVSLIIGRFLQSINYVLTTISYSSIIIVKSIHYLTLVFTTCMLHGYCANWIHIQQLNPKNITMRAQYITLTDDSGSAPLTEPSIVTMSSIARRTDASVSIAVWSTP